MTALGTPGYKLLRFEYNTSFDDPWDDSLEWWFALAEFLYHNEPEMVPESWEFRDSPMHSVNPLNLDFTHVDAMIWEFYDNEEITLDDALTFGKVLTRYLGILKTADEKEVIA